MNVELGCRVVQVAYDNKVLTSSFLVQYSLFDIQGLFCLYACKVFFNNPAIVIKPTPPGTGVMADVLGDTSANATSPLMRKPFLAVASSTRVIPTSMTTAPFFTISAFTNSGLPNAATMISASKHNSLRLGVCE